MTQLCLGGAMWRRDWVRDRSNRMKIRSTLGALAAAAAVASAAATVQAQTLYPPDGTYEYALKQGATTVATSTVTVKRSGSVVGIHEAQSVQDPTLGTVQISADESLLAESLAPLSFAAAYMASGKTTDIRVALSGNSGAFVHNGQRLSVPIRLLPGTQAMLVQDQTLVLSFLCVPGLVQIVRASGITQIVPTAGAIHPMFVDPAPQTKPSGVPAADAGVGIASPVSFSVWFDPRTGIVDEIDVPSQSLVVSLTKHS
jgi:hypothetical protein